MSAPAVLVPPGYVVTELLNLPCSLCGRTAATLAPPALPPKAIKGLVRVLDVAGTVFDVMGAGFDMPDLPKDRHPLLAFPPEQLSYFLGIVHPECIAAHLVSQGDGGA